MKPRSRRERIAAQLADLKMPGALEALDEVLAGVDGGGFTTGEAIERLLGAQIELRNGRRLATAMRSSRLPELKTLADFDFSFQPSIRREQIDSCTSSGSWSAGKTSCSAALGLALVENGFRVLYQRTAALVQKLQAARRDLALEAAIRKLHKYHLVILDDFSHVTAEGAETSVLFELIGARYENRSLPVIANEPFSAWGKIFGSDAMTVAAADRLVHRSHIFELNVESYRRRAAHAAIQAAAGKSDGTSADDRPEAG